MKLQKKRVVVDGVQWFKIGDHPAVKEVSHEQFMRGIPSDHGFINTLEGGHIVTPGDWIITGVKGEQYPCKSDIKDMTYEEVGPKIVVLCGSSRFVDIMAVCAWLIERDENAIAMGLHLLPKWYCKNSIPHHLAEHEGVAEEMDTLHLRKIDLANEIFVVNCRDYIGDSTRREVEYAQKQGKKIRWFSHDPIGEKIRSLRGGGIVMTAYQQTESARHYARCLDRADMPVRRVGLFAVVCSILLAVATGIVVGWLLWGWR